MDPQPVPCQVCSRTATAKLHFFCPQCARSQLYETRIHHAQALLDKEAVGAEIEEIFLGEEVENTESQRKRRSQGRAPGGPIQDVLAGQTHESYAAATATSQACADVQEDIHRMREELSEKRRAIQQREAALSRKKEAVSARGLRAFDPLPGATRKIETEWNRVYTAVAEDRMLLCMEVASLYGLDLKRRTRDSRTRDVYYLGDVPIVDLRELNNAAPTLVTVSLGRVAHLLHLTSHYLSLQLPAEITLPSSSNPHTLISTPLYSYKDPSLPTNQKQAATTKPRQRILYLDKPLPTLATEDHIAYSYFIDAVTLLAWNVAWLARTQGHDIGAKHWDEVCAVGRNLWHLFGPQTRLPTSPPPSHRTASPPAPQQPYQPPASSPMARTPSGGKRYPPPLHAASAGPITPGRLSHASAFAFLPAAGAQGGAAEVLRGWPLANPIRLIERVKAALAHERMGAEWEVLDKEAWAGHAEEQGSGTTTPLQPAPAETGGGVAGALSGGITGGTARMRELLLGRMTAAEGPGGAASAGSGGSGGSGEERAGEVPKQKKGWLRVRSQSGGDEGGAT